MSNMRVWLSVSVLFFFALAMIGLSPVAWAQGQALIFSATGDVPYGTSEISIFQQQITNHNKYSPAKFFVHVGDILSGSESCAEARYALVSSELKRLAVPAYIVPGDNETTDCSNPTQGKNWWLQYFTNFELNFCSAPYTEHQSGRGQNFAFTMDGVLFVGIDLVGSSGTSSSDQQKNADWVEQQFTAKVSQVRAAVVFSQAGPDAKRATFFNRFEPAAATFGKPVLFLHGDGHKWVQDNPWPLSNTMRIQVAAGGSEDPVQVTVTTSTSSPSTAFVFKRKPWSTSPTYYNVPPCANAGPDQTLASSLSTTLQGSASDDGDPGSSLTTTWSKVSGPGTVAFGNANALSTTVSFGANGVYVLRLTANDGQLQKSDEVTIAVNSAIINAPIISAFAPASGTVGAAVTVTGSNFSGATEVAFNGTPATSFAVISATEISAAVPAGATTGKITVATAVGAGVSADDFVITASGGGTPPITFHPTDDAHVESINATINYGVATGLRVETNSAADVANIYLKFNVTGLSGGVQSAKLRLACTDGSDDGGSIFSVSNSYTGTGAAWVESGLIWNNAPAIAGSALHAAGAVTSGQIAEFDVTAAITGNGVFSFAITSNSSNSVIYSSKEGSTIPELVIQTASTPPPSNVPTIASFAPASGPVSTIVTIAGNNFNGTTLVAFNGTAAGFTVESNTQIQATVPGGATTGMISVTNADGNAYSATDFVVTVPPPPTISSFTPAFGPGGTEVTITGSAFTGATDVTINGIAAAPMVVSSDSQIRATVPTGAAPGTGKIVVTTAVGSATSTADFTITSAPLTFSFSPKHDVYVTSASPVSNNGSSSTVRGKTSTSEVLQSYLKFEVTGLSGTLMSAKLRLFVSDASPDGGAVYLASNNYLSSTAPWIESGLNWNNAPGISGAALSSTGAVSIGQWVEFEVTAAIVGNGTYSFGLKSNNSDKVYYRSKEYGVSTSPQLVIESFSSGAPSIAAFAPADGPVGTEVLITGSDFSGTTAVTFNDAPASFVVDSNTQIRATVPVGATTGKIRITNAAGSSSFAADFLVTIPPAIASFTPASGPEGTEVIITGSNFTGTSGVTIKGNAATVFYVDSDTQIRALIPAGAALGTGKIAVTNSAGGATSAADFTIIEPPRLFAPQHDAYVKSSSPASNYGTASTLRGKLGSSEINYAYLKFAVTGLSGTLVSAKLRLNVSNASPDGGAVYLVSNNYNGTATPWVESGLNWNNAPAIAGAALHTVGAVNIGQWVEFDVTAAIVGDGTYSFALKNGNSDAVYYGSKEKSGTSDDPQLVIQMISVSAKAASRAENAVALDDEKASAAIPSEFVLRQNYPNPFNPSTTIRFGLPHDARVTIKVYSINGQEVKTLADGAYPAGMHAVVFRAGNLPSGAYFYVMQAGAVRQVRQLMLVK
jgi:hypothetical protein